MAPRNAARILPPWPVLALLAAPLAAAAWLQVQGTGDAGMDNSFTYLAVALALLVGLLWLLLGSGLSRRSRVRWLLALGAAGAVAAALVRIDGVTGSIVPELRFAGQPRRAAELAGGSAAPAARVDLATTTPDDFPGFLGPTRSAALPDVHLEPDWVAHPPELLWRVPVGEGWSGFAVVNGVAVTQEQRGQEQCVVARDVATGAELWRHASPGRNDHALGGPGPHATPTIAGGRVYAHDPFGVLWCLDGATGEALWRHDLFAEYGMTAALEEDLIAYGRSPSPLVVGDLVIVPAGGDPAGRHPGLVAFDRVGGALAWEGPDRDISHASPALATLAGVEQVLVVNADSVSGHDPRDGGLLWEHPWPGKSSADANNSQPVPLPPDRVLVSKGYGQGSLCLRLAPGDGGALTATPVWTSRRALRTKLTNVAVRGGHAYALSDEILECVRLADGGRVWRDGRYGHGQVLLVGEHLLVLSESGELSLVEATPERENHVLGTVEALDGKTWNTIAFYRDLVVVRNGFEAAAYRVALRVR